MATWPISWQRYFETGLGSCQDDFAAMVRRAFKPRRRGAVLNAPGPRSQVKKAGEPCKLYCKGRIIGYKRCAVAL